MIAAAPTGRRTLGRRTLSLSMFPPDSFVNRVTPRGRGILAAMSAFRLNPSMARQRLFEVVQRQRGPAWDLARPMEEQVGWDEHAAFMNALVERGFVALGGPVGDDGRVLLIVRAAGEEEIRGTLAEDPWSDDLLLIASIETWTIRLGELA